MHKLHFDTDLGGDIDDLCALAMVLNWQEVELTATYSSLDSVASHQLATVTENFHRVFVVTLRPFHWCCKCSVIIKLYGPEYFAKRSTPSLVGLRSTASYLIFVKRVDADDKLNHRRQPFQGWLMLYFKRLTGLRWPRASGIGTN